jgi:hypothetical protein
MLAALQNVIPTHLLDVRLWKALGLEAALEPATGLVPDDRLVRHPPS